MLALLLLEQYWKYLLLQNNYKQISSISSSNIQQPTVLYSATHI